AEFQSQGRAEVYQHEVIVAFGARMLSLLGCNVVAIQVGSDRMLTLDFSDGATVRLRPDDTGYESYSVGLSDGSIYTG
ncbi:MAG: hypothetical protein AB7V13_15400, partial [Pseudorhodoplanes sp.]